MQDTMKAQELFNQFAGKTIETMAIWAETNQRLMRDLVELSTGAAKEGVKLYSDLSRSAIDAIRESQTSTLRWQASWKDAATDPAAWYQKSVEALTQTAERLQATAEQAGKGLQESLAGAVSKLKTVYSS